MRDLPLVVARGTHGATTVAATMRLASLAGIEVFGAALWPRAGAVLIYAALAAALIWRPQGLLATGQGR